MMGLALAVLIGTTDVMTALEPRSDRIGVESHSASTTYAVAFDAFLWSRFTGWPAGLYQRAGLWLVLGLSLVLAVKVLLRWMIAIHAAESRERRAITYNFRTRLPVRATIWWRYRGLETLLAAELEWDGERFETSPTEDFVRWAKPNHLHTASLLLSDEGALEAAHAVEFHVRLWMPLVRKLKWSGEIQFATLDRTPVAAPISLSPVAVPSRDHEGIPERGLGRMPTAQSALPRQVVQGTASERDLVSIAAEFINSEFPDRMLLRQRLAEKGISPEFYSPARVQDSANCMFTRYWFKLDTQAGGWLWAESDEAFIAVPFDRSQLNAETMRHYLSSLYQGFGSGFDRRTHLQIESACWLARGREPDEYVVVKPGRFAGDQASKTNAILSPQRGSNDGKEERRREKERDATIVRIEARVDSLEAKLDRLAQDGESKDGSRRLILAVQDELRDVKNSTERELQDFRARLGRLEEEITSLKAARAKDKAPAYSREEAPRERSPAVQDGQAFRTDLPIRTPTTPSPGPPDVTLPLTRSSVPAPEPAPWAPPSEPAKFSSPSIPDGWKPIVAEKGLAAGVDDYLETLQRAYKRLGRLHVGMVKIVHLVESGDHGVYGVHTEDRLETDNGQLVARCAEKPTFRTPPKQFFLALAAPGQESIWILCPPGTYSSLGFDYPTLIDSVPASSFTIAAIVTPARLDRKDTALYRIAARMNVKFS